jgi:hypothetical protein
VTKTTSYGDISPQVAAYSASQMLRNLKQPLTMGDVQFASSHPVRRVANRDVPCRYCQAEPGQPCTKYHPKRGRVNRRNVHHTRIADARAADAAVRALDPKRSSIEPGDTVQFKRVRPFGKSLVDAHLVMIDEAARLSPEP